MLDFMIKGLNWSPSTQPQRSPTQPGDETEPTWPLSLTWDPDTQSSGLFLFPHPLFCVLSCMTLSLRIHVKSLW